MLDSEKRQKLRSQGWRYRGEGRCKVQGCTSLVEYWEKPGKGIAILDLIELRPHWPMCTGTTKARLARMPKPANPQMELFNGNGSSPAA